MSDMSKASEPLVSPEPLAAGKKNIIICCDGTGNEFGGSNSNVVKLYTALKIDNDQVGYYHPGVGTMGDPAARGKLSSLWSKVKGLAFGAGFQSNVLDAYRYLMENYNHGDRVILFGFSRGAYTARALAGLLDGYGLLCRGNQGHIPYAWRLYLAQLKHRTRKSIHAGDASAAAFKETFSHHGFRIHFVGLWDTVSSVGWISAPLRLYNVAENRTIDTVRHAVAIDERRCFYVDNLYGEGLAKQDIQQVWFTGAHSDVGGSYPQASSGLSNITLQWMIGHARKAGMTFDEDRIDILFGRPAKTYPAVQELFKERAAPQLHTSLTWYWWLLEILPHRYYDKDDGKEQRRIPLGSRRELPTGALVHNTVYERLEDKTCNYHPKNLQAGTLTEVPDLDRSVPRLYRYEPKHDLKDQSLERWLTLLVFVAVESAFALWLILWLVFAVHHSLPHLSAAARHALHGIHAGLHLLRPYLAKVHLHP